LWSGGALRYQNGTFKSYTTRDGLPDNSVTRVDEDDHGDMWFYTANGLSKLRNGKVEP
jgi:ligand-binding sensor domain-containing protein